MTKKKTAYSCQACGAVHFKWMGKCSECGEWNSLVEEFEEGGNSHFSRRRRKRASSTKAKNDNSAAATIAACMLLRSLPRPY
ncbi:hypothetical protein EBZ80_19575 [bacterium]|nr:hypothetical protein [bacterium]